MKSRTRLIILFLAVAIGAVIVAGRLMNPGGTPAAVVPPFEEQRSGPLPVIAPVEPFVLTNSFGETFNSEKLRGKVWAADMIFTTCPQMCEDMSKNMASLYEKYLEDGDFQAVSISVNPVYDTPEILHQYALRHGADPRRWHFLTGPMDTIKEVSLNSLKIGTSDKPIDHSRYFVLIDAELQLRGFYDGLDQQAMNRLTQDVGRLLAETPE